MKISGTIKEETNDLPVARAKILLYAGDSEMVTSFSGKQGAFETEQDLEYFIG